MIWECAGGGIALHSQGEEGDGTRPSCILSQHPLADRQAPPAWSASRSHTGTCHWRASPSCGSAQITPHPARWGRPCASVLFPSRVKTPTTTQMSHRGLLHLPNKRRNQSGHTHKSWRDIHDVRGPAAPAGLWLPGVIHSCVIQERGLEGPWGERELKKKKIQRLQSPRGSPGKTGTDPISHSFFSFLVPHLVPH